VLVRVISWIVQFLWKKGTIHEITRTKHETHYRLNLLLRQSQGDGKWEADATVSKLLEQEHHHPIYGTQSRYPWDNR